MKIDSVFNIISIIISGFVAAGTTLARSYNYIGKNYIFAVFIMILILSGIFYLYHYQLYNDEFYSMILECSS